LAATAFQVYDAQPRPDSHSAPVVRGRGGHSASCVRPFCTHALSIRLDAVRAHRRTDRS
jgi:hypothetical protein